MYNWVEFWFVLRKRNQKQRHRKPVGLQRWLVERQGNQIFFDEGSDKDLLGAVDSSVGLPDFDASRILENVLVVNVQSIVNQYVYSQVQIIPGHELKLKDLTLWCSQVKKLLRHHNWFGILLQCEFFGHGERDSPVFAIDPVKVLQHHVSEVHRNQSNRTRLQLKDQARFVGPVGQLINGFLEVEFVAERNV